MFFLLFFVLCSCLFAWCLRSFINWWFDIFLFWLLFYLFLIFDTSIDAYSCQTDICAFTISCWFFFGFLCSLFIILTLFEDISIVRWPTEISIIIKLTIIEIQPYTETIISVYLLKLRAESFLGFRRRKHYFQLLYGFSHFLLIARIVPQSHTEKFPHFPQTLNSKVTVLVYSSSWSTKRWLKSERINKLKFLPHYYSARRFLLLLNLEVAKIKVKKFRIFVK